MKPTPDQPTNKLVRHDKQWYIDRIGKRVFRTESSCQCEICKQVYEAGLIIIDEMHADYLYMMQNELGLYYFDTKN
jgi:hypothetical protein